MHPISALRTFKLLRSGALIRRRTIFAHAYNRATLPCVAEANYSLGLYESSIARRLRAPKTGFGCANAKYPTMFVRH